MGVRVYGDMLLPQIKSRKTEYQIPVFHMVVWNGTFCSFNEYLFLGQPVDQFRGIALIERIAHLLIVKPRPATVHPVKQVKGNPVTGRCLNHMQGKRTVLYFILLQRSQICESGTVLVL